VFVKQIQLLLLSIAFRRLGWFLRGVEDRTIIIKLIVWRKQNNVGYAALQNAVAHGDSAGISSCQFSLKCSHFRWCHKWCGSHV